MSRTRWLQRILLVLTDASPNDSMQVPPDEKHLFAREYEGDLAVQDAADAVRQMQRDGIRTAAIFFGASAHLDNVHRIYGQNYTRIRNHDSPEWLYGCSAGAYWDGSTDLKDTATRPWFSGLIQEIFSGHPPSSGRRSGLPSRVRPRG